MPSCVHVPPGEGLSASLPIGLQVRIETGTGTSTEITFKYGGRDYRYTVNFGKKSLRTLLTSDNLETDLLCEVESSRVRKSYADAIKELFEWFEAGTFAYIETSGDGSYTYEQLVEDPPDFVPVTPPEETAWTNLAFPPMPEQKALYSVVKTGDDSSFSTTKGKVLVYQSTNNVDVAALCGKLVEARACLAGVVLNTCAMPFLQRMEALTMLRSMRAKHRFRNEFFIACKLLEGRGGPGSYISMYPNDANIPRDGSVGNFAALDPRAPSLCSHLRVAMNTGRFVVLRHWIDLQGGAMEKILMRDLHGALEVIRTKKICPVVVTTNSKDAAAAFQRVGAIVTTDERKVVGDFMAQLLSIDMCEKMTM